jgi:Na+-driven multidrug efflux pump
LLLNLWWIPRHGIAGAALASAISYTFGAIYLCWAYRRLTGTAYSQLLLAQRTDWEAMKKIYARFRGLLVNE